MKEKERKIIFGLNIDKKGPLTKKDVEQAISIFKETYDNCMKIKEKEEEKVMNG